MISSHSSQQRYNNGHIFRQEFKLLQLQHLMEKWKMSNIQEQGAFVGNNREIVRYLWTEMTKDSWTLHGNDIWPQMTT
jgi:hypothetical protein